MMPCVDSVVSRLYCVQNEQLRHLFLDACSCCSVLRVMTEQTMMGDKIFTSENKRWSSYALDDDDGTISDMDDS